MSEAYFSPATFRFLKALAKNNSREWFHAHKDDYERHVRDPFLSFITDLQHPLAKISEHYRADPRKVGGSLFRIHRDTRFANDKTPYKGWSGARFFHARHLEIQAPAFYMHIQPGDCFAGGGMWHPEPASLKNIRAFLADNPESWKRATRSKAFTEHFDFWGESLTRPPRGFDPAHELIDDLKRKNFAAGQGFDESLACSSELMPHIVATFKRVAPMIDYLCAAQELDF
ncbi:uncharacterized protein (TIGR02453 family) [Luteibacter sp. Sphag1AF]|uniref:DUF2461 domain-containing protein n=1 Tax=Luteibacter sp. Sphag1AF TaxID=2587031 RepID=UPI00162313CD|nr:DUF2461 domain-containing protein [Luteibacter sp. Sphag1AF]MBB3228369.1 uncharacterized protein (TIGR02453 family) [Luteibacter sp. Sphag1AF]